MFVFSINRQWAEETYHHLVKLSGTDLADTIGVYLMSGVYTYKQYVAVSQLLCTHKMFCDNKHFVLDIFLLKTCQVSILIINIPRAQRGGGGDIM